MIKLSEPFFDEEEKKAALRVLDSGWYIHGKELEAFEKEFAEFAGTQRALACSNGTTAIHLALQALGIKKDDEVLVPSHTAFPTIEPILNLGAKPVFVDIDEKHYTLDVRDAAKKITKNTRAILPVHLYGHPAQMDALSTLCKNYGLFLVEDACQAHGALYKNRHVGSIGNIGCFSFYPSKNMTVFGDGGMIVTNDKLLYERIKLLRNHGSEDRYHHILLGNNFRVSEIACALGRVQLKRLPYFVQRRRKIAHMYNSLLESTSLILPKEMQGVKHSYHLYVIRHTKRNALKSYLEKHGVHSEIHYPVPGHLQKAVPLSYRTSLPVTEKIVQEILSLPMHPKLKEEQVAFIGNTIKRFLK